MKKNTTLLLLSLFLGIALYAQEDESKDAAALKSEIKALEKVISDTEKEIVKLEKSVVKTRPEAEQAKRDHINITELLETKRREAEAFQYDKKMVELKKDQKILKKQTKTQSKLQKSLDKNDAQLKDTERNFETAKTQQTRTQTTLDGVMLETGNVSSEEQRAMNATLKSKEAVDEQAILRARAHQQKLDQQAALQKELKSTNKEVIKAESQLEQIQKDRSNLMVEKKVVDEEHSTLAAAVEAMETEIKQYDPKVVKNEIEKLSKDADQARITAEKLQLDLDQIDQQIKEKHDFIEAKKIEVRDKESAMRRK